MLFDDMESVQKQLEALGLSDKEVKIYLAGLELGSATAQQLAAKAAVVRPTAYVAIGGLTKRGLMSSYTKGKKQYFMTEKPERLARLIQEQKDRILESEEKLKAILPQLESLMAVTGDKPEVKYYEGVEGLEVMKNVLFDSKAKHLYIIGNFENVPSSVPEESRVIYGYRIRKHNIAVKQMFVVKTKKSGPDTFVSKIAGCETKYLYRRGFINNGEIAIFGKYVSLISYLSKPFGVLLKSEDISDIAKLMFEMAWKVGK